MSKTINHRTELLFLYEIENANPNGDPINENRPRFDSEDSRALVSDVRLKRSIRDYWYEYKGYDGTGDKDIFVRETKYEDAKQGKSFVSSGKRRANDFKKDKNTSKEDHTKNVLNKCIDIRVFGGVLPLDGDSITFTGPCQFQMGKSLNETTVVEEQGTGAFASGDGKGQATFRTEYKLPYAIIGFNGIINEKAAAYTDMTETDQELLKEGIWEGTKNLISRSKFGQTPLMLLSVNYKEAFYIGNLRQRLKLECENQLKIRGTNDFKLDVTNLVLALKANTDKIASVNLKIDDRVRCVFQGKEINLSNGKLNLNEIK